MLPSLPALPLAVQSFPLLRKHHAIYVDKTRAAYQIMTHEAPSVFFTRPRRFGKSLMLSTLAEAYRGNAHLFGNTWLGDSGYDFPPHHVLHFNLSTVDSDPTSLSEELSWLVNLQRQDLGLPNIVGKPGMVLNATIKELAATGQPLVILIDEYESPLMAHLHNPEAMRKNQHILKNFFVQTKSEQSTQLAKVVMTGLTRLGLDNVESGANHFIDISFENNFQTLCGYTRSEIEHCFPAHFQRAAAQQNLSTDELWSKLSYWYNGYSWNLDDPSDSETRVYCPISIVKFFHNPARFQPH